MSTQQVQNKDQPEEIDAQPAHENGQNKEDSQEKYNQREEGQGYGISSEIQSSSSGRSQPRRFISSTPNQKDSNNGSNGFNQNIPDSRQNQEYVHSQQGIEKGFTIDSIAIIGTGPYGQGLAKLCEGSGLYYYTKVCFGSSKLNECKEDVRIGSLKNIPVYPVQDAISQAQVVFLAIPAAAEQSFAKSYSDQLEGKYVIELSNPQKISLKAADTIAKILQMIGIQTNIVPGLWYARQMETKQKAFFNEWWGSIAWFLATALFVLLYFEIFYVYYPKNGPTQEYMEQAEYSGYRYKDIAFWLPTYYSGDLSMFLFTLCYWPGPMLYCFKWFRGGKEFRIPKFMYSWLAARKYLGLLASYWMIFHTIGLMFMYFMYPTAPSEDYYLEEGITALTQGLDMTGIVCLMILAPIMVTSLPNQVLMWKEWHFVQSILGQALMVTATAHTLTLDYAYLMEKRSEWRSAYNPNKLWPGQYFMLIPLFIAMGFIFLRWLLSFISFCCRGNPIAKLRKIKKNDFAVYVWEL